MGGGVTFESWSSGGTASNGYFNVDNPSSHSIKEAYLFYFNFNLTSTHQIEFENTSYLINPNSASFSSFETAR